MIRIAYLLNVREISNTYLLELNDVCIKYHPIFEMYLLNKMLEVSLRFRAWKIITKCDYFLRLLWLMGDYLICALYEIMPKSCCSLTSWTNCPSHPEVFCWFSSNPQFICCWSSKNLILELFSCWDRTYQVTLYILLFYYLFNRDKVKGVTITCRRHIFCKDDSTHLSLCPFLVLLHICNTTTKENIINTSSYT